MICDFSSKVKWLRSLSHRKTEEGEDITTYWKHKWGKNPLIGAKRSHVIASTVVTDVGETSDRDQCTL